MTFMIVGRWSTSRGAVSYETAKELARILKPLVGKSPYNVQNTRDFIQEMKNIHLQQHECTISYDVKALFTSVPTDPAIEIIQQRTSMTVYNIICLLKFCLKNIYFIFLGRYYEQVEGPAMESPISPIVANLYMEVFEVKALNTAPHPPSLWRRFVDDTFVVIQSAHKDSFIEHINSIDGGIQFTMEDCGSDGSMPFWTLLSYPNQMAISPLQCTGSQSRLTCICNGTVIMPLQQNTVWWTHYIIELELCVPTPSF